MSIVSERNHLGLWFRCTSVVIAKKYDKMTISHVGSIPVSKKSYTVTGNLQDRDLIHMRAIAQELHQSSITKVKLKND